MLSNSFNEFTFFGNVSYFVAIFCGRKSFQKTGACRLLDDRILISGYSHEKPFHVKIEPALQKLANPTGKGCQRG